MNADKKTWISLALLIVSAITIFLAKGWPFKSAFFPLIVGVCIFLLAAADLLLGLSGEKDEEAERETPENGISGRIETKTETRRTVSIFLWISCFFLMIVLFGFLIAAPLLIFSYLKIQAGESWKSSLIAAGATLFLFYALFIWLMESHLPEGWLIEQFLA